MSVSETSIFGLNEPTSMRVATALHQGIPNSRIFFSDYELGTYTFFTSENSELKELWNKRKTSSNFFYVDKAYFARDRFFRVNLNSKQGNFEFPPNFRRLQFAGIRVRKKRKGYKILICPQSNHHFEMIGLTQESWILQVISELRKYTDRPIAVHQKAKGSKLPGYSEKMFYRTLRENIYTTVVHSSMAGIQSALFGVPCLVTDTCSVVSKFGDTDFAQIEHLELKEDRELLAAKLANNQWTLHEMANGTTWEAFKNHLN